MRAKNSAKNKNRITLPKAIADFFRRAQYFKGRAEDERVSVIREKIARLKLSEADVSKAVTWARKRRCVSGRY